MHYVLGERAQSIKDGIDTTTNQKQCFLRRRSCICLCLAVDDNRGRHHKFVSKKSFVVLFSYVYIIIN